MAIDNRPTFGGTLLQGMLQKAQLDQEKERVKILKDQQKIAEQEFKLQVQKFSFEQQTQKKLEGFRERQLGQAMTIAELGADVTREGYQVERDLTQDRLDNAIRITELQEGAANTRQRFTILNDIGKTALTAAQGMQSMQLELMDRGYSPMAAQFAVGSTGSMQSDLAVMSDQMRRYALGKDENALADLESMMVGTDRFLEIARTTGLHPSIIDAEKNPLRQQFKDMLARGVKTLDDNDVNDLLQGITDFANTHKKELFPKLRGEELEERLREWIPTQHSAALLAASLIFQDPTIGEGIRNDAVLNEALEEAVQQQGPVDPKLGKFASQFRNALTNAGTPFPSPIPGAGSGLAHGMNLEDDMRFRP